MTPVQEVLDRVRIAEPQAFRNLTVFPLLADETAAPDYLTLDEALLLGLAHVTELGGGGSVPELRFENQADRPVLLVDGEELLGAQQNRTINLTILVPAKTTLTIPVSCVEAGRWSQRGAMSASAHVHFASARAHKCAEVTESLRSRVQRHSNQGRVWASVAAKAAAFSVRSDTGSIEDVYAEMREPVEEFAQGLTARPNQIGAVFAVNGRVAGMELFDSADTFARMLPKLARSYALDALEEKEEAAVAPSLWSVEALLREVGEAEATRTGGVGLGEDLRLSAPNLTGGALGRDGRLVHLNAFRRDEERDAVMA